MTKINFYLIHKIVYWIVLIWYPKVPDSIKLSKEFVLRIQRMHKENGPIFTIAYIKMMKQLVMSHLSNNPQKQVKMIIGIDRRTGLPKAIRALHPHILSRDTSSLRFVFTLLSISRLIPGWKDPDLSPLVTPSGANPLMIRELSSFVGKFLDETRWDSRLSGISTDDLHFSNKAGPIGRATRDSLMDLYFMPDILKTILKGTNIKHILEHYEGIFKKHQVLRYFSVLKNWKSLNSNKSRIWKDTLNIFGISTMNARVDYLLDKANGFIKPEYHIRKLSIVKDPEAKSRIIAIFDYWSQLWLKQIHSIHFNFLRTLENDRTFTQDPIIIDKPSKHRYYSFDLSSATDRFPLQLQQEVIKGMFGQEVSDRWAMVLTTFPFYVPWEDKTINYNCGQPMGAYSSWSTFTITHHMIMYYIHHKLNLQYKYYMILGDDIVIYHDDVAVMYQHIMKELDVGISIPKSCISSNMYEFAKRIFLDGIEITGIQIGGIYNNINKYHLIYQSVYEVIYNRNYVPPGFMTIPDLMCYLYIIIGRTIKQAANIRSRVDLLHSFHRFLDGHKDPLENYLVRMYHNYEGQLHFNDVVNLNNYVYSSIMGALDSKQAEYINFLDDLLNHPENSNIATWGLVDQEDIHTAQKWFLIQLPLVKAIGNTVDALRKAKRLDSFKEMIEVLALPSPSCFQDRASVRLIGAKAKIAKRFLAEFEQLVIQGRPANNFASNLGNEVLTKVGTDIKNAIRSTERTVGLYPPAPVPKPKMNFSSNINDYI